MAIDCGEIILPTTPPDAFAATVTTGSTPIDVAVVACSFPNKALAEVSDPVIKTPNQPNIGAKKGNSEPVFDKGCAMVRVIPESLIMYANASIAATVMIGNRSCFNVVMKIFIACLNFNPINGIAIMDANKTAVPDADK